MFHGIVPALLLTLRPQGIYTDSHPISCFHWEFFVTLLTLYSQRLHSGFSFTLFHPFPPPSHHPSTLLLFIWLLFPPDFIVFLSFRVVSLQIPTVFPTHLFLFTKCFSSSSLLQMQPSSSSVCHNHKRTQPNPVAVSLRGPPSSFTLVFPPP